MSGGEPSSIKQALPRGHRPEPAACVMDISHFQAVRSCSCLTSHIITIYLFFEGVFLCIRHYTEMAPENICEVVGRAYHRAWAAGVAGLHAYLSAPEAQANDAPILRAVNCSQRKTATRAISARPSWDRKRQHTRRSGAGRASNNGETTSGSARAVFTRQTSKRVYIIDEVHMLSTRLSMHC